MGGEPERVDPGPPGWQELSEPQATHLVDALPPFEDALWYLEAAATPEEILVNLSAVLWTAAGLLRTDGPDLRIDAECRAWQAVRPEDAGLAEFLQARDQVVRDGWQLDGLARGWLSERVPVASQLVETYAGLGDLALGAAGARLMLVPAHDRRPG
jgi:hypothetical protein